MQERCKRSYLVVPGGANRRNVEVDLYQGKMNGMFSYFFHIRNDVKRYPVNFGGLIPGTLRKTLATLMMLGFLTPAVEFSN